MSNPIPSSLALTNIATGSPILSSTHDTNYSAIQTAVNEFVTALNSGVVNQALISAGGAAVSWLYPPGYELGKTAFTSTVVISSTTEATPTTVVTAPSITFDGTPVILEFWAPQLNSPTTAAGNTSNLSFYEGATELGQFAQVITQVASQSTLLVPVGRYEFTPAAGSHTYSVGAWCSGSTTSASVVAGAGGTGTRLPGFIRVVKA